MEGNKRGVYRHADLDRILNPQSIAIVGATSRPGSFGDRLQNNLVGYDGRLYLINAKYDRLGDLPCYPSLSDLPEVPDCVAINVPREAAESVVVEAGRIGAGGAILYASGYAETRKVDRIGEQRRLSEISRTSGLRIIGPNCLGLANYLRRARITFAEYPAPRPRTATPAVGIASQSGALSQALAQALERGTPVSHVFSAGNQCDVDVADFVAYLADDRHCRSIVCVFEGLPDPMRMFEAAEIAWQADKPLLIHKIAIGPLGAEAAIAHTGSLAGSNEAYRAAFERAGALIIDDFEGLMEAAAFFAKAPSPRAKGVAVAATSGGAAIMAADKAEIHGVSLPQPGDAVRTVLEAHIPDFGSARNPCDVTAQVITNPQSLKACGEALMSDEAYGAVVLPQPVAYDLHTPRIGVFSELSHRYGKITCNVLISDWLQGPGTVEAETDPHVAIFRSMDRCFATLAAWHRRHDRKLSGPRVLRRRSSAEAATAAAALLGRVKNQTLAEREAKAVMAAYGIPVVAEVLAKDVGQAIAAASDLGYPVAMMVASPDLPHAAAAGAISRNLKNEAELRAAFAAVMANASEARPQPRINGLLIQPMFPLGAEVMVRTRVDPFIGPLVVVGVGGALGEILKDTIVALAPVTLQEARDMLERLRGIALLRGFHGAEPVDVGQLADAICRLSELGTDLKERIAEIDVNPLICSGGQVVAADASFVLRSNSAQS